MGVGVTVMSMLILVLMVAMAAVGECANNICRYLCAYVIA